MQRCLGVLVLAVSLGGCASGDPLSETQRAFLTARGRPLAFTIAFADRELDASGMVVAAPERRIDVWMYGGAPTTRVTFDDGYFVEEASLSATITGIPPTPSPGDFRHGMGRAEIEGVLGAPDRVETEALGSRSLEVLRWDTRPDVVSVAFVDGELTSVVAGLQVQP